MSEARLARLQKFRRTTEAEALADALYGEQAPETREDQMLLGRVYFSARAYDKALGAWRLALGAPERASGSPEELFDFALCHARTDDYDTAAVVYARLLDAHPRHRKADFASFKLGYMKYDRGECGKALLLFDSHRALFPDSRHLDEALWFSSRCHWRAGRHDQAMELLAELEQKRPRSSLVPGAAYWRARAESTFGGNADKEKAGLEAVLQRWPESGYAWFASQRLGRRFPTRDTVPAPPYPASWADRPAVRRSEALLAVGLRDFALDELDTLPRPTDRASTVALAHRRLEVGDYQRARRLACKHADDVRATVTDPLTRAAQQACMPRPEGSIVERHAAPYGLDPAVAYGVMWAESALSPRVTSAVGARGLMQLMPEVGGTLHEGLFPKRPYDADDLYRAPYNAALGTTELGQRRAALADTLERTSTPAVIASYNAGEEVVRRWLEEAKPEDGEAPAFDTWAEDISYTETRRYVKRVLGHVMSYRWLYGDAVASGPGGEP